MMRPSWWNKQLFSRSILFGLEHIVGIVIVMLTSLLTHHD
jgi:hypothetical protein